MSSTILYIDDEIINLEIFKYHFGKTNTLLTALNATEGLTILEQNNSIQMVVSDMRMPGLNGLEFVAVAKEKYPHIHFYILTGFDLTPTIEEAIKNELIVQYFEKPLNISQINKAIELAE